MRLSIRHRMLTVALVTALSVLPLAANAALVGTGEVAGQPADVNREKVRDFLDRANVKEKMMALGVDALFVDERVDALNDDEVAVLAQKVDGMPAGGHLEKNDYILILLALILVAIIA